MQEAPESSKFSVEPADSPGGPPPEPTCVLLFPFVGGEHVPRRMARKRNDSFRKTKFTMADRGALRRRAVPGRSELAPVRCPGPRFGPRLRTAGSAPELGRRRRAPGPRSRRRWGGLLLTARRPRLPQCENGRRPRLRWGWGRRGQDVPRPFHLSLVLASGTTRAEQTGSTTRGGRPLCDVIRPRRPYCGPAGFPR